jgi:hypothetical protein
MKFYKLTDQNGYTRFGNSGETLWGEGTTLELPVKDNPQ